MIKDMHRKFIIILFAVLLVMQFAGCGRHDNQNIASIDVPEKIFLTEELGIGEEDFVLSRPNIGDPFKSEETENAYLYWEKVDVNDEVYVENTYTFVDGVLAQIDSDYRFRRTTDDIDSIDKEKLYEAFNVTAENYMQVIEERYDTTSQFDGFVQKYDGISMKEAPGLSGIWTVGENRQIGIMGYAKISEDYDFLLRMCVTYTDNELYTNGTDG